MNSKILLFLTLLITTTSISAQIKREKIVYKDDKVAENSTEKNSNYDDLTGRFILNLGLGGNFGLGGGKAYSLNGNLLSTSNVSYGNGIDFQVGLGYNFNQYITGEININYQSGISTDIQSTYSDTVNGSYSNINETDSYSANGFKICPQIVISYPTQNIIPYLKFGPVLSFSTRKEMNVYDVDNLGTLSYNYEDINSSGVGFSSCFGLKKNIYKTNKYLFIEFNHITLTQSYEKGSMVSATFDNNDILSNIDISDKEYIYVSALDINYNNTNPNIASKRLTDYFNFNSWGLKIGLIFIL